MSLTPKNNTFDYAALDDETKIALEECTAEIQSRMVKTVEQVIAIGQQLQTVKLKLKHGQFYNWLNYELGMHPKQANRFILVAQQFKSDNMSDLNIVPSALYLLAELQTPESGRQEAISRAKQGENITVSIAKEIVSRHRVATKSFTEKSEGENDSDPSATKIENTANDSQSILKKGGNGCTTDTANISRSKRPKNQPVSELEPPLITFKNEEKRAEHAIIHIFAETIEDSIVTHSPKRTAQPDPSPEFKVDVRIRILRRQEGADKWTGCIARIWEITPDGWLRVDVEGHTGVRFTLKPDWVELFTETDMNSPLPTKTEKISDSVPYSIQDTLDPAAQPNKPQSSPVQIVSDRVRFPVEINGEALEVDGVVLDVKVRYQHQGKTSTVRVPLNSVVFEGN